MCVSDQSQRAGAGGGVCGGEIGAGLAGIHRRYTRRAGGGHLLINRNQFALNVIDNQH